MKKIIAIILALAACLSLFACDEEKTGVDYTVEYYAASLPTKIVTTSTQTVYDDDDEIAYELDSISTLVTGKIGGSLATVETYEKDVLRTVTDGSTAIIVGPIDTEKGSKEYLQGKGTRDNGGSWYKDGLNFGPVMGSIAIAITNDNVKDVTYTEEKFNNKLSFTVTKDKIDEVFGTDAKGNSILVSDSDVKVEITNNGAVVTSITLSYEIEEYDDFPARSVTVRTDYSYKVEEFDLLY